MREDKSPQIFNVGDTVRVVSSPYRGSPAGWMQDMDYYCGKEATISRAMYDKRRKMWFYGLEDIYYWWCENCFEPPFADIEESDEDISILF